MIWDWNKNSSEFCKRKIRGTRMLFLSYLIEIGEIWKFCEDCEKMDELY